MPHHLLEPSNILKVEAMPISYAREREIEIEKEFRKKFAGNFLRKLFEVYSKILYFSTYFNEISLDMSGKRIYYVVILQRTYFTWIILFICISICIRSLLSTVQNASIYTCTLQRKISIWCMNIFNQIISQVQCWIAVIKLRWTVRSKTKANPPKK